MNIKSLYCVRNIVNNLLFLFLLYASITAYPAELDEDMPAQPATLSDRKSSLQNRLQFPGLPGDIFLLLLCTGDLTDRGRFTGQVNCFRDKDVEDMIRPARVRSVSNYTVPDAEVVDITVSREQFLVERFEREVLRAANGARLEPARLEGKRAPVRFNFAVKFERSDEVETIEVFLHHFRNVGLLGTDYIASQRYLGQQNRFAEEVTTCPRFYAPVWIRSIVMNNGSAYNVSTEEIGGDIDENVADICVAAFQDKVKTNLYVPAIVAGRYVNSFHVELFYDNPNQENNLDFEEAMWEELLAKGEGFDNLSGVSDPQFDAVLQGQYYREWLEVKGVMPGGKVSEPYMSCTGNPYIDGDPALMLIDCSTPE